jgi:aconitate hydratase
MLDGIEGGMTRYIPTGETMAIFDAAMRYQADKTPLIVIAGAEYGTGSSRDWAAKGTNLLGVKAVLTESFERIHRSNLVGMGVLPLQFKAGVTRKILGLTGDELFSVRGIDDAIKPLQDLLLIIDYPNGEQKEVMVTCRIDTLNEVDYFKAGGILHYVLRKLIAES